MLACAMYAHIRADVVQVMFVGCKLKTSFSLIPFLKNCASIGKSSLRHREIESCSFEDCALTC